MDVAFTGSREDVPPGPGVDVSITGTDGGSVDVAGANVVLSVVGGGVVLVAGTESAHTCTANMAHRIRMSSVI